MKEVNVYDLKFNPMHDIAKDWMLVTAGDEKNGFNTMTASWGHVGSIWGHGGGMPTAICYVRPQRYTRQFIDREPLYTLSFLPVEKYRKALSYLGTRSGKNEDKVTNAGLHPVFGEGFTYFEEASLVLVCRKIYQTPILENGFVDKQVLENCYPERDFHDMYLGEIVKVFVSEDSKFI